MLCDSGTNFNVPNVWTTSVKGASATLTLNSIGQPYVQARVFGTTAKVPDSYSMPGGATEGILIGGAASITVGPLAAGTQTVWKPAVIAGDARYSLVVLNAALTNTGSGILLNMVDENGGLYLNHTQFTATAFDTFETNTILPKRTTRFTINNQTTVSQTVLIGLTMKGY